MRLFVLAAFASVALAGCLSPGDDSLRDEAPAPEPGEALRFSAPVLIDEVRAGGEPVIVATPSGVLVVSTHPGLTHAHPSDDPANAPDEAILPTSGQSYLWRSVDGGSTWTHVGLPGGGGTGPRGAGPGVGDPDLALRADGTIFHTDLEALVQASVSWSTDEGETWVEGNPAASGGVVDRQWLASHGRLVYFTGNYFVNREVRQSADGVVWQTIGHLPTECSGDLVASRDGVLYAGCGAGVAASEDAGATWARRRVPDHRTEGFYVAEPAVDGAGTVWITWQEGEASLYLAGSPDRGATWPWIHDLTSALATAMASQQITVVWPWASAGSVGRVAVTLYATPTTPPSDTGPGDRAWSVVVVAAFDAASDAPDLRTHVVKAGHHRGAICQDGTLCQTRSLQGDATADRRLGDFFETTIDAEGFLHVVYADTTARPDDAVSHPGYVRQTGGPRFVVDGYVPTQG